MRRIIFEQYVIIVSAVYQKIQQKPTKLLVEAVKIMYLTSDKNY